jgi:hypothetical protein
VDGISYLSVRMDTVVELLLKALIKWIKTHPDAAFSRFMLKQRGPRTDVRSMNRLQRLTSALRFLLWGCLFLALWLLTAYLTFALKLLSPEHIAVQVVLFGLALLSGVGVIGGLYLLLRVLV